MCAGVQKLSRPIERCQETSQCAPIATEVTATAAHQRYQGILPDEVAEDLAVVSVAMNITPDDRDRIQPVMRSVYDGVELQGPVRAEVGCIAEVASSLDVG